jgi:hypothetical protein
MEDTMKTTTVSPRISDEAQAFYRGHWTSLNAGAQFAIEAFKDLYSETLGELCGIFEDRELALIVDVAESFDEKMTPYSAGRILEAACNQKLTLEGYGEKWGVDKDEICKKLLLLSRFEAACLEIWAASFYKDPHHTDEGALQAYVKPLAGE